MSTKTPTESDILRPVGIESISKTYLAVFGAATAAFGIFLVGWFYQLYVGMSVTGLSDWGTGGGVTWGLYIGAFIWWVGIAHGGIILSAAVRLLGMDRYMPVARLAEMLTLAGLSAAGFYIIVHMGRPDRMVTSVIGHYHITVNNSPLVWDVTVITAYFVLTATYLGLTLRYDVSRLRDDLPSFSPKIGSFQAPDLLAPIYNVMTLGYSEKEDKVIERMVWWVALAIIIMAPLLLHGGVIPWLFALLPTYPGWFGAIQGPQFLTIALTSAISGVILVSYAFRRAYDWDHIITDDIFRGLLLWLGFFCLLFLWLQLQQLVSGTFSPTVDHAAATASKLSHPAYIVPMLMVLGVLAYIFATTLRPSLFNKKRAIGAAVLVLIATLVEKTYFVVAGLWYPAFDIYSATPGEYFPSLIELSSVLGTIGMVALFFLVISKLVPVVELHAIEHLRDEHGHEEHTETESEPEVKA
ncbi:NrfD/PsrC family molybdoenzyme membrane anchor subunit [Natronobacterium gregoryi]|uniref:Dehydrogenase n=2 Tax=Natronobacterium gregoryi TaxID=44930 RepID=L0AEN6_NATGS|nr:NrfD/PsrC family molybdoenzyme membrane anchor subunit [Natronobacterium gregoryi]AFZ71525.1 polysulfide reductase [Natronobacterium gregoryi SP2]ELY66581.1 polysulfide reductase NrfD [Natronobacterium gregoryi SP2]PLK21298.1 dehydrogenase [Natronobacterium gregoryi SP2]SFI82851.1 quinol:cytochrome c oxidoreductase quinone-binding subunit 1 [Natronobacterium gregoryi]